MSWRFVFLFSCAGTFFPNILSSHQLVNHRTLGLHAMQQLWTSISVISIWMDSAMSLLEDYRSCCKRKRNFILRWAGLQKCTKRGEEEEEEKKIWQNQKKRSWARAKQHNTTQHKHWCCPSTDSIQRLKKSQKIDSAQDRTGDVMRVKHMP